MRHRSSGKEGQGTQTDEKQGEPCRCPTDRSERVSGTSLREGTQIPEVRRQNRGSVRAKVLEFARQSVRETQLQQRGSGDL